MNNEQASIFGDVLAECGERSVRGGWWQSIETGKFFTHETELFNYVIGTKFALIHSEVTEAMEGFRTGAMDDKLPHRRAVEVELADAIIRIGDLATRLGLDVAGAMKEKMEFNAAREDHKVESRRQAGGKKF